MAHKPPYGYLQEKNILQLLDDLLGALVTAQPADPKQFIHEWSSGGTPCTQCEETVVHPPLATESVSEAIPCSSEALCNTLTPEKGSATPQVPNLDAMALEHAGRGRIDTSSGSVHFYHEHFQLEGPVEPFRSWIEALPDRDPDRFPRHIIDRALREIEAKLLAFKREPPDAQTLIHRIHQERGKWHRNRQVPPRMQQFVEAYFAQGTWPTWICLPSCGIQRS
mmetsp:Transcript_73421/g.129394  ORF Transcript_73421/g.129394 Transcript_73421/m.129394 type:complete len:223 (-) Transcript_73421:536-1204(-)